MTVGDGSTTTVNQNQNGPVLQNFNTQSGEADAEAYSDEVQVWSYGNIRPGETASAPNRMRWQSPRSTRRRATEQQQPRGRRNGRRHSTTTVNQNQNGPVLTMNFNTQGRRGCASLFAMRSKFGAMATLRLVAGIDAESTARPSPRLTKALTAGHDGSGDGSTDKAASAVAGAATTSKRPTRQPGGTQENEPRCGRDGW